MGEAALKPNKSAKRPRTGAGRPAACEVAGRMELLLDTAAEVFLECGYKNANVAEIANRAGASKRTIYARYPSKAELFCAVVSRKIGELQEAHARTLLPNEPLAKVLDDYGMSLLQSMLRPQLRALFQVVVSEIGEFPELACAFWELGPKRLTAMLEEYLATHPEFKGEHPDHAAEMFCCLCWGIAILKKQFFKEYVMPKATMRQNVTEAVRIFMAAYATAPTAQ